jgi:hypothetical protein
LPRIFNGCGFYGNHRLCDARVGAQNFTDNISVKKRNPASCLPEPGLQIQARQREIVSRPYVKTALLCQGLVRKHRGFREAQNCNSVLAKGL